METSDDRDWRERAQCRGMSPALFFPVERADPSAIAKATCAKCPVRIQCDAHAFEYEDYGYWAGEDEHARRKRRRTMGVSVKSMEMNKRARRSADYSDAVAPGELCADYPCDAVHPGMSHSEYRRDYESQL